MKPETKYILAVIGLSDYNHAVYSINGYWIGDTSNGVTLRYLDDKERVSFSTFDSKEEADMTAKLLYPAVKVEMALAREFVIITVPLKKENDSWKEAYKAANKEILEIFTAHSKKYHAKTEKWLKD